MKINYILILIVFFFLFTLFLFSFSVSNNNYNALRSHFKNDKNMHIHTYIYVYEKNREKKILFTQVRTQKKYIYIHKVIYIWIILKKEKGKKEIAISTRFGRNFYMKIFNASFSPNLRNFKSNVHNKIRKFGVFLKNFFFFIITVRFSSEIHFCRLNVNHASIHTTCR